MSGLTLFDPVPFSEPETSAQAAHEMRPHIARLEAVVLQCIKDAGEAGACDHEIESATGLAHQTASARRRGLVLRGLVEDSGMRRVTPSGRAAKAWRATK